MTFWSRLCSWSRAIFQRNRMESEMETELRFHIDTFAEELVRSGVSREEAVWFDTSSSEFAIRSTSHRSSYFCSRAFVDGRSIGCSFVSSRTPRDAGRSHGGAEVRMKAQRFTEVWGNQREEV